MRQPVPFIEEKRIFHPNSDKAVTQRCGKDIDDILSTSAEVSSWDDFVTPTKPPTTAIKTKLSITMPAALPQSRPPKPTETHIRWIPIHNGAGIGITITGNIDLKLRGEWRALLRNTEDSGITRFEFYLDQTSTLSLTGLAMLMVFKEQKKSRQADIKLCHCNPNSRELVVWTGMDQHFAIEGEASITTA